MTCNMPVYLQSSNRRYPYKAPQNQTCNSTSICKRHCPWFATFPTAIISVRNSQTTLDTTMKHQDWLSHEPGQNSAGEVLEDAGWTLRGAWSHLTLSDVSLTLMLVFPTWTLPELDSLQSLVGPSLAGSEFNPERCISDLNSDIT